MTLIPAVLQFYIALGTVCLGGSINEKNPKNVKLSIGKFYLSVSNL